MRSDLERNQCFLNKLVTMYQQKVVKTNMFHKHIKTHNVQDNIPDTALNVCVLRTFTFLYT